MIPRLIARYYNRSRDDIQPGRQVIFDGNRSILTSPTARAGNSGIKPADASDRAMQRLLLLIGSRSGCILPLYDIACRPD